MSSSLDARARDVFDELIDRPDAQRASYLQRFCDGDAALRARVEALLAAAEKDDQFLRNPSAVHAQGGLSACVSEQPGERIGPYTLVELIGEGGFGSVFLARQIDPVQRDVALKIIKAGMDTRQVIGRFEVERQALALMEHPNIARVLEAGATDRGRPYFVMELVRGEPITRYCDRECLSLEQRLGLFRDVCAAVQHAHQKGIIHRDLKPSNILVAGSTGEPIVKVIDFGVAKATTAGWNDHTLTGQHQLVGTPEYMSPEQMEPGGVDIDTRTDIYSLGVVLYELLTGATPFDRQRLVNSGFDGMRRILREEEPLRPSARLWSEPGSSVLAGSSGGAALVTPGSEDSSVLAIASRRRTRPAVLTRALRGDLDWIVLKCLEKDRARRFETASALADDVARYLDNQPVLATPPSVRYKFGKFVQRNRATVIAVAAVAAALVLGSIGTTIGLVWAVSEQRRAEEQTTIATREADQARAVNEFMRQILTSVDPQNSGADVRLMDVLASASASASQRFADHPFQEAQVRDLLGEVYLNLSLFRESEAEYQRSLALWREHAGDDDPRKLVAEKQCAGLALNLLHIQEAEQILNGLVPRLERVFGPDDFNTLDARRCVAIVHKTKGRLDDAERILLELRNHPQLVNNDRIQILVLHTLTGVYLARPAPPDGEKRAAWEQQLRLIGRERVERAERSYGPHSTVTLLAQGRLASILNAQHDYHAAIELCRAVLANSAERLGACHVIRSEVMPTLATALGRMGESDEPAELYLRCIECIRQQSAELGIPLLVTIHDSLPHLERAGRAREGEALAREVLSGLQSSGGGHGETQFTPRVFAAAFVSMQGRLDEAEALFEPLIADELPSQASHRAARLHRLYAGHLRRCRRFEQAEQHLTRAIELLGDIRRGTYANLPDELLLEAIALADAAGTHEKVAEYRQLLTELRAAQP